MKYVITIAEYHSGSDGELYNSIIVADSEQDAIEKFKDFLSQEELEGHESDVDVPDSFEGLIGLDFTDTFLDREYRINGVIIK